MPKLTIDLDNYSEEDQELMQAIWRKFKPIDKKKMSHACDSLPYFIGWDEALRNGTAQDFIEDKIKHNLVGGAGSGKYDFDRGDVAKNATTEDPIWKPEPNKRETYYFNCAYHMAVDSFDTFGLDAYDEKRYQSGNVFKTEEAAQRMADRRKRIGIFENKMMEFSDGYEYVERYCNYCIVWNHKENEWVWVAPYQNEDLTTIYMTCKNAKKAVEWANKHYPEGV